MGHNGHHAPALLARRERHPLHLASRLIIPLGNRGYRLAALISLDLAALIRRRLAGPVRRRLAALIGAGLAVALPAGVARAAIVWTGDAEQPASEQWASAAANGPACNSAPPDLRTASIRQVASPYPVAQGQYSYRFQVSDGDYCYGARAELGQGNPPNPRDPNRYFDAGQERWISFQAYLPDDYQLDDPLGESTGMLQIKQEGADGQPALGIGNGEGYLCLYLDSMVDEQFSPHCGNGYYDLGQPAKNAWIKLTLQVWFSTTHKGFVQVWGDLDDGNGFRLLLPRVDAPTMKAYSNGDPIPSQARIGIYRSLSIQGTEDLYIDGFTVATDRASAEDNAFAPPIATAAEPETAVTLAVAALAKRRGSWVRVHGRISPRIVEAARVQRRRVIIGERVRGHWRPAARGHTAPGGTFSILVPLLSGRRRKLLLRATIVGVGRSNTAVLRFS